MIHRLLNEVLATLFRKTFPASPLLHVYVYSATKVLSYKGTTTYEDNTHAYIYIYDPFRDALS